MRVSFLAGFVLIFCFVGCAVETTTYSPPAQSDIEFDSPSEPAPTAETLYAMANIFASQGRDRECEMVTKEIISRFPEFSPAYNDLAELQMRQGRTNEAIATIHLGLDVDPDNPMFLNNLGMCRLIRMEYENALEMFSRAAGIVPEIAKYRANMAATLALMGRYEESLSLFEQVLEQDKANHNVNILREIAKKTGDNCDTK